MLKTGKEVEVQIYSFFQHFVQGTLEMPSLSILAAMNQVITLLMYYTENSYFGIVQSPKE